MNKIFQLLFIAFILVVVWFHKGLILGGGEAGIIFYNFPNELQIVSNAWVDKALGNPAGVVTSWYPYFVIFSTLQKSGIPPVILQASLFYFLLSIGFTGMYLLVKQTVKDNNIAFIASLFYNLNLFALTIVWSRFQYPYMFFYASLPLALYIFRKGLRERMIVYAFLLALLTVSFATAFASVPLLLLFWIVLGGYLLYYLILQKRAWKNILWAVVFFFVSFGLFIFSNIWWLLQLVQTVLSKPYLTSQPFTSSDNYITFNILSESLGHIDYLMRLMHKDYFVWMSDVWGHIYFTTPFILFSFLPIIFVFGSLLIKKKPHDYYFFLLVVILGVFFAKGNADPFGGILNFLFIHISVLEVLRNPFEKIGLIIPLGYAPLFAYGVFYFYTYIRSRKYSYATPVFVSILVLICGVLVWPMWNGWVFTSNEPPTNNTKIGDYIKIPGYYADANNWLNAQPGDLRTIAIPLKGEGLTYKWDYGYNGVDPSSSLFNKPYLSLCTGVPYLCSITDEFQPQLIKHPETFWKILPPLHANRIMIREDADYKLRQLHNPINLKKILSDPKTNFSLSKTFNKVSFYSPERKISQEKIFGTTSGIFHMHPQGRSFIPATPYTDYQTGDIYFTDNAPNKQRYELANTKQIILQAQPFDAEPLDVSKENAELALPYVRFLPDSRFYLYTRVKEKLTRFLAGNNSSRQRVIESDKRLIEIIHLIREKKYLLAEKTLAEYEAYLNEFLLVPSLVKEDESKRDLLRQKYVFTDVVSLLKTNNLDTDGYIKVEEVLNTLLDRLTLNPKYPVNLQEFTSYQINVPEDGEYRIVLETDGWSKFYKSSELWAVIDGRSTKPFLIEDGKKSQILFQHSFSKGRHQIDIKLPPSVNVLQSQYNEFAVSSETGKTIQIPFVLFDPFSTYTISFDYFNNKGNIAQGTIIQDIDLVVKGQLQPKKLIILPVDKNKHEWKRLSDTYIPDTSANKATMQFQIYEYNDCLINNPGYLRGRCEIPEFKKNYNKESKMSIKNLLVTRKMNNNLFLIKDKPMKKQSPPIITYVKLTPAKYMVKVKNVKAPYFLTFLESYDPRWKAYLIGSDETRQELSEDKHVLVNSFANSWYMEKTGNYELELEFLPERQLDTGKKISLYAVLFSISASVILLLKRKIIRK
jgi:hypothetical protein